MNRLVHRAVTALLLAALAACQSMGNGRAFEQSAAERSQSLRPGVSTRDDVRREFGEAVVYEFDDGSQSWSYQTTRGIPKWVGFLPYVGLLPIDYASRTTELALLFDPQGVLRKMEWHAGAARPAS